MKTTRMLTLAALVLACDDRLLARARDATEPGVAGSRFHPRSARRGSPTITDDLRYEVWNMAA